jgi:hypothetical protein
MRDRGPRTAGAGGLRGWQARTLPCPGPLVSPCGGARLDSYGSPPIYSFWNSLGILRFDSV